MDPIELPPEANPLTTQNLFNILQLASSSNQQQVQTSTLQLQNWENQKGYYSLLQTLFIDTSLPVETRHLAIILLKNGIDRHWRKVATDPISKDDKATIRSRLLDSGIHEANPGLALQNALVIAKVVRFEYPNAWPDGITKIIDNLRSSSQPNANPLYLSRTLLILLQVIKELATGRLQRTRADLQSVAPELLRVLGRIYMDKVGVWRTFLASGGDDEGGAMESMEQSLLAIKVLRRILIAGFEFPNREKDVQEFWKITQNHFGDFLYNVNSQRLSLSVSQLAQKHLLQLSKIHLEVARRHQAAFALLPDSVNLVRAYWGLITTFGETYGTNIITPPPEDVPSGNLDDEDVTLAEKLCLKGLLLIRASIQIVSRPLQTIRYRHEAEKEEQKQAIELIKTTLLTKEFVTTVMEVIVSRFFVFRPSDLQDWEKEPEEWEIREEGEGDGWEFSVRPCSEKVFLDLIINFKDLLVKPLLDVFATVSLPNQGTILFKDSIYTAVGLAASVLHKRLDFDAFLNTTLAHEVRNQQPGFNILRRRIGILLGQWVSVRISGPNRPLVYDIFRHLLNQGDELNDDVVRLTAGRQFKNVADEWEFKTEDFLPYAPDVLTRLMALIQEVELTETKMTLLNTVSVVVERMEHNISPYADRIISLLPPLWTQSGEEHLMKQAILIILTRLVESMKGDSRRYHDLVLPLIKGAIEPGSETQVYLLEDALDLWGTILRQTPSPASPHLLSVASFLFPMFELGSENLRKALNIAESYILLCPSEMLDESFRNKLFLSFASLLGTLKVDLNGHVTHLVEIIVRSAESLGGEQAVEVIGNGLAKSGFLKKVLEGLHESWKAHQTSGPNKKYPSIESVVETDYLAILARIALVSPRMLFTSIQVVPLETPPAETIGWLLTEWFAHFESIGSPHKRKLMCLALTKLLDTGQSWILGRLQDLITIWTDVITELREGAEDRGGDSLVYWDPDGLKPSKPEAPEDERRRNLTFSDPVHTINITEFVRHHLQRAVERCGGMQAFQDEWLQNVDRDVVASFGALGVM